MVGIFDLHGPACRVRGVFLVARLPAPDLLAIERTPEVAPLPARRLDYLALRLGAELDRIDERFAVELKGVRRLEARLDLRDEHLGQHVFALGEASRAAREE